MKGKSNFTQEQREKITAEALEIGKIKIVADRYQIPVTLLYGWVKALKNKKIRESKKSDRDFEKELAERDLEIKILRELLKKTTQTLIKD